MCPVCLQSKLFLDSKGWRRIFGIDAVALGVAEFFAKQNVSFRECCNCYIHGSCISHVRGRVKAPRRNIGEQLSNLSRHVKVEDEAVQLIDSHHGQCACCKLLITSTCVCSMLCISNYR